MLDSLLAARAQGIQKLRTQYADDSMEETLLLSKLMAYCSREAHSCVEKAAMIGFVKLRILEPDECCSLRGDTLRQVGQQEPLINLAAQFVHGLIEPLGISSTHTFSKFYPIYYLLPHSICGAFGALWCAEVQDWSS